MAPGPAPSGLTFLDRTVYLEAADALVVADVHLGRGVASAVEAPIDHAAGSLERLERVLEAVGPSQVVVAGDLLHSFSTVPLSVDRQLRAVLSMIETVGSEVVVTRGNHDTVLSRVYDGPLVECYHLDAAGAVVAHGHEEPEAVDDLLVIGHAHPAMTIEGRKYPCFLYGPNTYDGADVLVLPAFTDLARGVRVNGARQTLESPLVSDLGAFHPAVSDPDADAVLWFPPLEALSREMGYPPR